VKWLATFVRVGARQARCGLCSKRTTVIARVTSSFVVGDLVSSTSHPDWWGQVVDAARLESGYVSVRWRSPSGISMHRAAEEPIGLVLQRAVMGESGER
jgi:hypothetical protein